MAKRKTKTTVTKAAARLSETLVVQLNNLFVSNINVRTIATDDYLDELGEDILRRGQLYPLLVEKELDDVGNETGRHGVIAGGRRYRALMRLLEKGRIDDDFAVKCEIPDTTTGILAEDHSLAENVQRLKLHPVDQFKAFMALMEKGMSEADIAAAYFVSPLIVRQRIKLARVAPELLEDYIAKEMTLEQLEAFAITDAQERQRHVWASLKHIPYGQQPYQIRRHLMETSVQATDRRARFIGVDTYAAAGGAVTRDLFGDEDDVYLEDTMLLDKLFMEKLEGKAEEIRGDGWKWVKPLESSQNTERYDYEHHKGTVPELSDEQQAKIEALQTEADALGNNIDDLDDVEARKAEDRYDEIEALIEAMQKPVYSEQDKACCGVFLYVNNGGDLVVEEGFVDPADNAPADETLGDDGTGEPDDYSVALEKMQGDSISEDIAEVDEPEAGLSDRLISGLTQHRTKAARNKLAKNPDVALTLLVTRLFRERYTAYGSCSLDHVLQVSISANAFGYEKLEDTPYGHEIDERYSEYKELQGLNDEDLWYKVAAMTIDERLTLLAHCLSYGLNLVEGKAIQAYDTNRRRRHKDLLFEALDFNMREEGFIPDADNCFSMMTKAQVLDVIAEVKDPTTARHLSTFKKDQIVREAERITRDADWLPVLLRSANDNRPDVEATMAFISTNVPALTDQTVMVEAAE